MTTRRFLSAAIGLLLLAGCAGETQTAKPPLHSGMSSAALKSRFGEPLRIEPSPAGGEDWYYHFVSWKTQPSGSSETSHEFGQPTSSVTVGLEISRNSEDRPVHVSPEGYVTDPLPEGRIVKN